MLRQPMGLQPHAAPNQAVTNAQLQALMMQRLDGLASVLQPLCGPRCHFLMMQPDPKLDGPMELHRQTPNEFVVHYRADEFQMIFPDYESVVIYALAHEMGHYIDIAVAGSNPNDTWDREISADVIAGCALALRGVRLDLVRAAFAATAPEGSIDSRLDLVCGSDNEHPAARWGLGAIETGAQLCHSGIVPLKRLETEAANVAQDAKQTAETARRSLPPLADPCRWRRVGRGPRTTRTDG